MKSFTTRMKTLKVGLSTDVNNEDVIELNYLLIRFQRINQHFWKYTMKSIVNSRLLFLLIHFVQRIFFNLKGTYIFCSVTESMNRVFYLYLLLL